jgi:hypothetical protein
MKQEPFFTDIEVCKFTQTEKLNRIFEIICTCLQVTETEIKKYPKEINTIFCGHPGYTIYFNSFNFDNVKNVISPFPEIKIAITPEKIVIYNNVNLKYVFAPDQILTVYNRFKKIKEL